MGIPSAYVLGFTFDFKVYGLQAGMGLAMLVQAVSYFTLIVTSDFQQIVKESKERIEEEKQRGKEAKGQS